MDFLAENAFKDCNMYLDCILIDGVYKDEVLSNLIFEVKIEKDIPLFFFDYFEEEFDDLNILQILYKYISYGLKEQLIKKNIKYYIL